MSDALQAHVFVGLSTAARGESARMCKHFVRHGFKALDLTHEDLAQDHIRHMVGGCCSLEHNERLLRFVFPGRAGQRRSAVSTISGGAGLRVCGRNPQPRASPVFRQPERLEPLSQSLVHPQRVMGVNLGLCSRIDSI
jgi:hypothetical protein